MKDSGIAAHLLGISDPRALRSSGLPGPLLENAVLTGLLAWRETRHPRPGIHFWRTAGGAEVDFVIESGRRQLPVVSGFAFGSYVLKLNPAILLGALTGAMTSTPALGIVTQAARSSVPALGYSGTYTFANVLLTFAGGFSCLCERPARLGVHRHSRPRGCGEF